MGEDLADDPRILNGREQAHAAATARTREDIKLEGAPHQVGPGPVARRAESVRLELHDAARARVNGTWRNAGVGLRSGVCQHFR